MPDNRKGGLGATGVAKIVLLAVLLAIPVALYSAPLVSAQTTYSAWLKLVTPSWNGVPCPGAPVSSIPPMRACPNTAFTGFADRYNLTGDWYWVEVYHERGAPFNDAIKAGAWKFYPNATGFVKITWPASWPNVTIVAKAKSYDGTEIGAGELYRGIIVYMLVVNGSRSYLTSKFGPILAPGEQRRNATILLDGSVVSVPYGPNTGSWAALLGATGGRAGPVDSLALFPAEFNNNFSDPRNAWVANASVVFTPFRVHTWYSLKDNLSYAQVKVYFLNRTDIASGAPETAELLRAFVTKGDGSGYGLYDPAATKELYPTTVTRYSENELVPIPLEAVHIQAKRPYRNAFYTGVDLRAHLNATVRVWWETVLVNTTFFAGRDTNGYSTLDNTHINVPGTMRDGFPINGFFAGATPLLEALNLNYNYTTDTLFGGHSSPLALFLNSTVFYWRCGARDDDLAVNGTVFSPLTFGWGFQTFNSSLFDAACKTNLRDSTGSPYYLQNQIGRTLKPFGVPGDGYALSANPHDWPGYLSIFQNYLRVPNATQWMSLVAKYGGLTIGGTRASDLVYTSRYYTGTADITTNDPTKVAITDYLKTIKVTDDPGPYRGFRLEIEYRGGFMNEFGGASQTVGVFIVENPYLIALKDLAAPGGTWPAPYPSTIPDGGTISLGDGRVGRVFDNTVPTTAAEDPIFGPRNFETNGKLAVVANVSDIVFIVRDNQGSLLSPSETEVWLLRENGPAVRLKAYRLVSPTPVAGRYAYEQVGPVSWPFLWRLNVSVALLGSPAPDIIWVAFQVPEELMYGVAVKFEGITVYENGGEISKLVETVAREITASVFKLKLIFVDCEKRPLSTTPVFMIDPVTGARVRFNTGPDGTKDIIATGEGLTLLGVYWKGVDVPLVEARLPDDTVIPATDGKITIPLSNDIRGPVKVVALINDIKFSTYDYQGKVAIPRLNVTVWWVGYNISDPLRKPWYFLETMDPRGYGVPDPTYVERLGVVPVGEGSAFDAQRWNTSVRVAQFFAYVIQHKNATNEYIFYQMPPAIYNITVTTVVPIPGFSDSASPGIGFWPGEGQDRAFESTIVWKPGASSVTPFEEHVGAKTRVVLREFNKDLRFTACGALVVNLNTWAHQWNLEMIDADLKIGDVSFDIINDNSQSMTLGIGNSTKWDMLTLTYLTKLYGDNRRPGPQDFSYLWWNGSYRLVDVRLTTNMSFTVDKFYNRTAGFNKVWPALNFTLQPNAELHQQQRTYSKWITLQDDFGYKIIVYDKETLRAPLPVTFVKPKAVDKGGSQLENALIEVWILNVNASKPVDISAASGSAVIKRSFLNTICELRNTTYNIWWKWETKRVADPDAPQRFKSIRWDRLNITIQVGTEYRSILVQVPPWPAKLFIRNATGTDLDLVVTSRYIYSTVANKHCDIDNNVGANTPMKYPQGQLAYARWTTGPDGLIKSFTVPGYEGLLLLPTSGWLNHTFSAEGNFRRSTLMEEFHYQFNVVWKSAVVYSDNFVLDKKFVEFGASEVYDVRFMFTLSNSTSADHAVRNLNLWIYYPNVTTWHDQNLWNGRLPVDYEAPLDTNRLPAPQDYRACSDSVFGCALRVTLISSADADGVVEFSKIPGPRFMNTTWKYVFSANHSAITWLDDLVATQFVLNNETFGYGPLKEVSPELKDKKLDVPIMLNAAHQLRFLVLGWRDEQGQPTAYPLEGFTVRYEIRRKDAGLTVASGTVTSTAEGTAEVRSDPTDPRKVLWAGLTVRYRVEPPSWLVNVKSDKWLTGLGDGKLKDYVITEGYQAYEPDPRPSIGAYFPDEVPTHFAITEISTRFVDGWCYGLCTAYFPEEGRTRSKPYVINVDYTIVTVRALDFNGRPLVGAFVEIVERASGRVAGWSYTFNATWKRQPIDLVRLYDYHDVKLLKERDVGGAGYTEFIPVAVGPWNYDANNDDRVDATGYRGDDPRTPAIEGTPLQFIVRVYWLATDANPDDASGNLKAVWPFIDPQEPYTTTEAGKPVRKSHVKVYDSDFDETDAAAKTLVVPIDSTVTIRKPSDVIFKYDGVHRDVTAAVFDFKAFLKYLDKTLPGSKIREQMEVHLVRKVGETRELLLKFVRLYEDKDRDGKPERDIHTITVYRLPRGVYELQVIFKPVSTETPIFSKSYDISVVNVGTVTVEAVQPFVDLSFEVTDLKGRPLPIAEPAVKVTDEALWHRVSVTANVVTIETLYTGAPVTITVSYTSPLYGTSADVKVTDTADGLKTRLLGGRTLQLPVDDVTVTVVDRKGQPIGGAVVKLGQAPAKSTGGDGRAVFERVPLESAGRGITYSLSVSVGGVEVTPADARSVELSTARTSVTVIGELFSLPVRVIGTLGQGLAGANVRVVKGAVTVASASTDQGGFAQFDRLVLDTYTVVANYKGYTQEVSVSSADLQAGKVVEITLPIYTELLGIPMPLSTLLALIIGLILLVVVIAIIVSEYRWWRGRRLGVYPPAPPKPPK
jgi:hypothetical protein